MISSRRSKESDTASASSGDGAADYPPAAAHEVRGESSTETERLSRILAVSPWRKVNRVGLKLSLWSAGLAAVATLMAGIILGPGSVLLLVPIPLVVLVGTYVACVGLMAGRLELARTLLRQIRKHQFQNLEAADRPRGDELNDLTWQVYRTGKVLENELEELKRMENYRREFMGNVSHELKTPIFAIRGFAETLENGALDDPRVNKSFVNKIVRNADRLENLARDLGEIARIEQGELKMQMAPFNVRDLALETLEFLEPRASVQNVRLNLSMPEDLPEVVGDIHHLRQVIVNLTENAIKYNDHGGVVEIVARLLPRGEVKLSVVDNGIGIPDELIPRITERFFRVDKSRSRSQGGTGLGLAIVKHILAAHDRSLMVESKEGAGSTFGFCLPVHS